MAGKSAFGATKNQPKRKILPIQASVLKIMRSLLEKGVAEEDILDFLREIELEYFSLLDKLSTTEMMSNIDAKTNLLKYSPDHIKNIVKTASRFREIKTGVFSIGYIRIDLDDFSRVNNLYGHEFGDKILIGIADVLKKTTRPTDYSIRFGGEELDVILPYTDIEGAVLVAEKIRQKINHKVFRYKQKRIKITASIGVSMGSVNLKEYSQKVKERKNLNSFWKQIFTAQGNADDACYDAKNSGKNRVATYDSAKNYDRIRKEYTASKAK